MKSAPWILGDVQILFGRNELRKIEARDQSNLALCINNNN